MCVKDNIFSIQGWISALIIYLIITGALANVIFFRVEVMGQDVSMSVPSQEGMKSKLK